MTEQKRKPKSPAFEVIQRARKPKLKAGEAAWKKIIEHIISQRRKKK